MQNFLCGYVDVMKDSIISLLRDKVVAIYLYGSSVLNDYKYGWSDIDILCLTDGSLTEQEQAYCLSLRQSLVKCRNDDLYRTFEGVIVALDDFISRRYSGAIYWGTSGQKITNEYSFDVFSLYELINHGQLIYGRDIRGALTCPAYDQLREGVINHYQSIRKYALNTNESLYSCGWLLDISRCIYTLRTGRIIAKTQAGKWAMDENICPVKESLARTLEARNNPTVFINDPDFRKWLCGLGPQIQQYADILEREIESTNCR